jgi:hypothetical protein
MAAGSSMRPTALFPEAAQDADARGNDQGEAQQQQQPEGDIESLTREVQQLRQRHDELAALVAQAGQLRKQNEELQAATQDLVDLKLENGTLLSKNREVSTIARCMPCNHIVQSASGCISVLLPASALLCLLVYTCLNSTRCSMEHQLQSSAVPVSATRTLMLPPGDGAG